MSAPLGSQIGEAVPRPRRFVLARNEALAALAVAAIAAIAVPGSRAGIGLAIVAAAVIGCGLTASRRRDAWRAATFAIAAALALTPLLRDAAWLVAGDLAVALLLTAAALVDGASWRNLAAAPGALLRHLPPAPGAVFRGSLVAMPSASGEAVATAIRGTVMAGGLVLGFGALFASADQAFAEVLQSVAPRASLIGEIPARFGVALLAASLVGGLALTAGAQADDAAPRTAQPARRGLAPLEWAIPLVALVVLFAGFVVVQFVVLFAGSEHVLRTTGLTYADYAHQGFGQLLAAAGLVLGVIGVARVTARTETPAQRVVLRLLLGALCVLTLVVVASALHRLDLYVDVFGATRLRLLAATTCAALGGVVALVLATVVSGRRGWLPRAVLLGLGLIAVALAASNPDARIAERNVERYLQEGRIDAAYAASLSADATPELAALPDGLADQILADQRARLRGGDGAFGFNIGRESARIALAGLP